jgi:uncharacterized protein YqgC (DUF456 family)
VNSAGLALVGLAILVGLLGVVVPILPGLLLCLAAVLVWALVEQTTLAWVVLATAAVLFVASQLAKVIVPSRRMKAAGVPRRSLVAGSAVAIPCFFLIPVVGALLGFVLGIYAAERHRLGTHQAAWRSTRHALKAVGLSILIELAAGLLIGAAWLAAVLLG